MIAPTEKVENILNNYKCRIPVEVVPSGVDFDTIVSDKNKAERDVFRRSIGIEEGKKVILYSGRIAEEKNLDELIDYLGRNKPENVVFLIVGDGPYREETKRKIEECGLQDMTIMTGMVDYREMKNYYCAGDIFVSASQSETQGLTYIEALANGLVLLCKKDKCLDNVLTNGINGYSYSSESEFSEYLKRLLSEDISSMQENAAEIAKQKFSVETFAEQMESIYCSLLKQYAGNSKSA